MATSTRAIASPSRVVEAIPSLPGLPLLGNLLDFRKDRLGLQDRAQRLGPISGMSIGPIPLYTVTCADMAHRVLVDDAASYKKSAGLRFMMPLLGDGLLTAEFDVHKKHRKLLAPAFAPKRLANYGGVMVEETQKQI